jgi:hypothetical protein
MAISCRELTRPWTRGRLRVTLWLTVSLSVLVSSPVWGSWPDIYFDWKLQSCPYGAPSLTRGRVCHLSVVPEPNEFYHLYVSQRNGHASQETRHVTTTHRCVTSPRTQKHSLLYCCLLDRVYRAVAWQRVNQIRYNVFLWKYKDLM